MRRTARNPSIAYPIYDLALVVTLVLPMGVVIAVANRRFSVALGLCLFLLCVDVVALAIGRICRLSLKDYFKSTGTGTR